MSEADSPEDGHTFRFRFDIRGSYKVVGDPVHTDSPAFMGPVHEIQVRAWNLRDALRKASELPFDEMMEQLVSHDALPDPEGDPAVTAEKDVPLTWRIEHGQIRMGAGVEVLIDNPDVKIVDIDCDSKYPEVWVALHEDGPELILFANENTLRWNTPMTEPTRVKFSPGWDILAPETGRYTIRVALYRTSVFPPAEKGQADA